MIDLSGPYAPEVLTARQAAVFGALGSGAMVLPSAPALYKSRDTELRYRPSSELAYVTGVRDANVVAVFRGHVEEERLVLFAQKRDPARELWTGPGTGVTEAAGLPGVQAVHPLSQLEALLPDLLKGARVIYSRPTEHEGVDRAVLQALKTGRYLGSKDGSGPRGVLDPGAILDDLRLIKGPEELEAIRAACRITVNAFKEVGPAVRAGQGEWHLEAAFDAAFRQAGAWGPAYPTIVGSGPNACVLHHTRNDRVLGESELVLIDAGAELNLYASDVTRTLPVGGTFTPEQRALYKIVAEAQVEAVCTVRPGTTLAQVHAVAEQRMVQGLLDLGVLEGTVESVLEMGTHKPFVPHSTSHWLGLDVHDVGDYAMEGESRVLEPGMVFSVEPGLYLPEDADGVPASMAGLGVRIEDDVLVTDDGFENLTRDLPVAAGAVEEWLS